MVPCRGPKPLLGGECDLKGEWLLDVRPDSFGFLRNRSLTNARCSAPTTHLRARFAFTPLAVATTDIRPPNPSARLRLSAAVRIEQNVGGGL